MAGTAKAYNLPFDYVLYNMSWANTIMYGAVLPGSGDKKKDKGSEKEIVNADDPRNKEKVKSIIQGYE